MILAEAGASMKPCPENPHAERKFGKGPVCPRMGWASGVME